MIQLKGYLTKDASQEIKSDLLLSKLTYDVVTVLLVFKNKPTGTPFSKVVRIIIHIFIFECTIDESTVNPLMGKTKNNVTLIYPIHL